MLFKLTLLTLLTCCYATPPPDYVKPPEVDKYPPKYEYGYNIQNSKGDGQGKSESREGVFSLGRYYVQLGDGSKAASQNVEYITDEWGYHPLVEYSSVGEHSQTSTQFALGEKAVEALRKNNHNQLPSPTPSQPQKLTSIKSPTPLPSTIAPKLIATQPGPTKITPVVTRVTPAPIIFKENIPGNPTPLPKLHHPLQENIPLLRNALPLQYVLPPLDLPQPQYLIQAPPVSNQNPQNQFLIQNEQTSQPQHFYIPLYNTGIDNNQNNLNLLSYFNIPSTQQTILNTNFKNDNIQKSNINEQALKVDNINQNNQRNVEQAHNYKVENIVLNSNVINNKQQNKIENNQYLLEEIQNIQVPSHQPRNQNIVILSQNSKENGIQIENNGHVVESSTLSSIINKENLKENVKIDAEVEYITKAIQNELNLHNTEPLFENTVSEVKYITSNKNTISTNNPKQKSVYDESILNMENPGGYGARINAKKPNPVKNDPLPSLIDRTRNLVTGVDVLNINDAITDSLGNLYNDVKKETINNNNIIHQYTNGNVQYGYNENVPNTILEVVSNYNNQNLLNPGAVYLQQNNLQDENVKISTSLNGYSTEQISSDSSEAHHQSNLLTSSSTYNSDANAIKNSRNKLLEILNSEKVISEKENTNRISFAEKPIIVADLDNYQENGVSSTTEVYQEQKSISDNVYSTTHNTVETKVTENNAVSTEIPILITPRPVSNNFLAPITAAVSLQNSVQDIETLKEDQSDTSVEVQKSVPYYLGKVEFIENFGSSQEVSQEESLSTKLLVQTPNEEQEKSQETNISSEEENYPRAEALIQTKHVENNLYLSDQLPEQGQIKQEIAAPLNQPLDNESSELENTKIVNKPTEITKYIEKPYPVEIPVPYEVEKIIEKPVEITKIVEKQVPVHIPQPYPVEVEKIVEKQIKVPVEITKYIDNPYPVHIPYPQPIAIPVEVEKLVQTVVKEPYPVEVRVPVEIKVPVPHPVQVTKYIDKPYPVEKIVEKPVTVEKIVEKPITKYIEKPYPVPVHIPVPHPIAIPVEIKVPQHYSFEKIKYFEKPYGQAQAYSSPIPKTVILPQLPQVPQQQQHQQHQQQSQIHPVTTKLVQIPLELQKYLDRPILNPPPPLYLNLQQQQKPNPYSYAPKYQIDWKSILNCDLKHGKPQHQQRFVKIPDYIGLVPPQKPTTDFNNNQNYKRRARNSFGQNLRIEYGFKPPIIPSVQTDEFGMPLNNED